MVESDNRSDESIDSRISRRKLLAMTSSTATVGLAGCSADDDAGPTPTAVGEESEDGGDTEETDGSDETVEGSPVTTELAHRAPVSWEPDDTNVNPFSQLGDMQYWMEYMWWEGVTYPVTGPASGEAAMWTVDEIEFQGNGCEILLHFRDDFTWWDGTDVTARDYMTFRELDSYQTYGAKEDWEVELELVDDYTFKETHPSPLNPDAQRVSYISPVSTKHGYWQSWLERYEDAGSQNAMDEITRELTETRISMQEMVDEGLGNGFWIPEEWDPTEVVHRKYEDHPRADWTNVETDRWVLMSENQKAIQAFQDDRFDVGESLLPQVREGSNDNIEIFQNFPNGGVPRLVINQRNKHLARPKVRQALAYLIDYEELREVIKGAHGTDYLPHTHQVGMSSNLAESYTDSQFLDQVFDYGQTAQPDMARQRLQEAGYSEQGGEWVGPDGDAIGDLEYITPPWGIYQTTLQYIGPKLTEFGIGVNTNMPSSSAFWQNWENNFDFDLCNWFSSTTHPSNSYLVDSSAGIDNFVGGVGSIQGIIDNRNEPDGCAVNRNEATYSADRTERFNIPVDETFPSEIGAAEVSGSGQQVKPVKWNNILSQSQDQDEIQDISKKLAWWFNWSQPHIGLYEEKWTYWGDTTDYRMPGQFDHHETEANQNQHYVDFFEHLTTGHITARTE